MQTLKTEAIRNVWIAGDRGLLFQFSGARMLVDLGVNLLAAQKAFHRAVIAPRMAGLIASEKRVVDVALDPISFPANSVDDRMAIASELRIFRLQTRDQPQRLDGRMVFESLAKKLVETLRAARRVHGAHPRPVNRDHRCQSGNVEFLQALFAACLRQLMSLPRSARRSRSIRTFMFLTFVLFASFVVE